MEIGRIYSTIQNNLELQPDDFEPSARESTDPRWKRNVRNILQHRKQNSEIIWIGNGAYMLPPSKDSAALNSTVPVKPGVSREQFERLQQIRKEVGDEGEEFVIKHEKTRLSQLGKEELARNVVRVSITNSGAGYDIHSFEPDGSDRFIEVKATLGVGRVFEWTANEVSVARKFGDKYWIYRGHELRDKPEIGEIIQNPASKIGNKLTIEPSAYLVRLIG